jgi:hypothetical protein
VVENKPWYLIVRVDVPEKIWFFNISELILNLKNVSFLIELNIHKTITSLSKLRGLADGFGQKGIFALQGKMP